MNSLNQNYPNPFKFETNITFSISEKQHVLLNVYNIRGKLIQTLINENKVLGSYFVNWDVSNVTPGIYIYKIKAGNFHHLRRCIVLK